MSDTAEQQLGDSRVLDRADIARLGTAEPPVQPDKAAELPQQIASGINHEVLDQISIAVRGFRGNSPAMERCLDLAAMYARLPAPILIYGETGTGKRDLVKAIHDASGRPGSLITVDCSQVPNGLLASTLFGHNKGSFTGAVRDQIGLMEQADGGTLYLDEVENLPHDVQQMLLLPLDSKRGNVRARRLGNGRVHDFNVRIVCAANTELEPLVQHGKFRADLFQRISTLRLRVPALRERGKPYMRGLVEHLIEEIVRENLQQFLQPGVRISVDPEAMEILLSYTWPGNVREMNSVLYGAIINAVYVRRDLTLRSRDFDAALNHATVENPVDIVTGIIRAETGGALPELRDLRAVVDRSWFAEVLSRTNGNVSRAARMAQMDRGNFNNKIRRLGLDPKLFRER